jgi:hypothetical protein
MSQAQLLESTEIGVRPFTPFGGVFGWLADLAVSRRANAAQASFVKTVSAIESYYVAEPNQGQAMRAIRMFTGAGRDAKLTPVRMLSRKEIDQLGLRPGQVKRR